MGEIIFCNIYTGIYGKYKSYLINKDAITQYIIGEPSLIWKPQI